MIVQYVLCCIGAKLVTYGLLDAPPISIVRAFEQMQGNPTSVSQRVEPYDKHVGQKDRRDALCSPFLHEHVPCANTTGYTTLHGHDRSPPTETRGQEHTFYSSVS